MYHRFILVAWTQHLLAFKFKINFVLFEHSAESNAWCCRYSNMMAYTCWAKSNSDERNKIFPGSTENLATAFNKMGKSKQWRIPSFLQDVPAWKWSNGVKTNWNNLKNPNAARNPREQRWPEGRTDWLLNHRTDLILLNHLRTKQLLGWTQALSGCGSSRSPPGDWADLGWTISCLESGSTHHLSHVCLSLGSSVLLSPRNRPVCFTVSRWRCYWHLKGEKCDQNVWSSSKKVNMSIKEPHWCCFVCATKCTSCRLFVLPVVKVLQQPRADRYECIVGAQQPLLSGPLCGFRVLLKLRVPYFLPLPKSTMMSSSSITFYPAAILKSFQVPVAISRARFQGREFAGVAHNTSVATRPMEWLPFLASKA